MLHNYSLVGFRTSSSPEEYFGKFLSLPDELIDLKCYKIFQIPATALHLRDAVPMDIY